MKYLQITPSNKTGQLYDLGENGVLKAAANTIVISEDSLSIMAQIIAANPNYQTFTLEQWGEALQQLDPPYTIGGLDG